MGDLSIAQDIIDGVADAMGDLGSTRMVRLTTYAALDPLDPGAGGAPTDTDVAVQALISDYSEDRVDGTTVLADDKECIVPVGQLTLAQAAAVRPGARLLDGATVYEVVRVKKPEVAGRTVVIVAQLRGA